MCDGALGGGPEAPVDSSLLLVFQRSLLDILVQFNMSVNHWRMGDILCESEPAVWLNAAEQVPSASYAKGASERVLYMIVHHNVSQACNPLKITDKYPVPFVPPMQPELQKVEAGDLKALERPMARS